MGEGKVPVVLPGVFLSLTVSKAGRDKVCVEVAGNDTGIGKSGIVRGHEMDNVGREDTGAGNGTGQMGRTGHKKAGSPDAAVDDIGREDISMGGPKTV